MAPIRKNLYSSPYTKDERPAPFVEKTSKAGWYSLKIKGAAGWAKRSCGTAVKWEALLAADMVHVLRLMGKLAIVDEIAAGDITLAALREHWMRVRESILTNGGKTADLETVLHRIIDERATETNRRTMSGALASWATVAPKKHSRYLAQIRTLLALPWVEDDTTFFTLANCDAMLKGDTSKGREGVKNDDGSDMSTATLHRYFSALKAFGRRLKREKIIAANPLAEPRCIEFELTDDEKAAKAEVVFYTETEVKRIVAELQRMAVEDPTLVHVAPMVALAFATGAEINALMRLTRGSFVNLRAGLVKIDGHKNQSRRNRTVDISVDWATKVVLPYVMTLPSSESYFLPRTPEQKHLYAPYEKARAALVAACAATGVTYEGFHKFRHSLCQHWIAKGLLEGRCEGRGLRWIVTQCGWKNERQFFLTYAKFISDYKTEETALAARAAGGDWWEPTKDEARGFLAVVA